ncbi:MAG: putative threonine efflux protein [Roseibaca calidilacus]|uniref:Putative threonine efflux protein n=1 Tax=Roseibaca calidilacus TaxID=1666912 RepID=A0A0P7WN95_9RHOB|nr:LysE family translocator [Roseibaca calidilacus]KPP92311.1 MAG: putative threonine efflux protein [Roseibaca calidilacus]CUX79606.1 Threonine/homoserine/homoserine lactone efflux protein [Roseibaca calidilacus]
MTFEIFAALLTFAFVTAVTPGPNNVMLMASGVNFGFRRTIPHMAGVALGHAFMVFLVGVGLMGAFISYPPLQMALKVVSALYMLWLAWKIATAVPPSGAKAEGNPLTFLQAAAFQWVNPKAWIISLAAVAIYAPDQQFGAVAWVALGFLSVGWLTTVIWTAVGVSLRRLLTRPSWLRLFNYTMAALLLASLYPVLFQG